VSQHLQARRSRRCLFWIRICLGSPTQSAYLNTILGKASNRSIDLVSLSGWRPVCICSPWAAIVGETMNTPTNDADTLQKSFSPPSHNWDYLNHTMLRIGQDFGKGFQNVWHLLYEGSVFIIQEWATGVPRSTLWWTCVLQTIRAVYWRKTCSSYAWATNDIQVARPGISQ
jgi:hypothetical protein